MSGLLAVLFDDFLINAASNDNLSTPNDTVKQGLENKYIDDVAVRAREL